MLQYQHGGWLCFASGMKPGNPNIKTNLLVGLSPSVASSASDTGCSQTWL